MPLGPQNIDLMESMRHVQAGGLPIRAQLRLADETRHHLFTSDLTVSEFLLAQDAKCSPISQVMGSSIFHVGKIADYKGATGEIETISQAHRDSRRLALSRCFQEAQVIGADAVIGMRIQERLITMGQHGKGGDDGDEVIEFTVFGTAVRAPWITHAPGIARRHRPERAGPLGAGAGRLRAVRLPLRVLPLPRVARDEERHRGQRRGHRRARRHRGRAAPRGRQSSSSRRPGTRRSSSSAPT